MSLVELMSQRCKSLAAVRQGACLPACAGFGYVESEPVAPRGNIGRVWILCRPHEGREPQKRGHQRARGPVDLAMPEARNQGRFPADLDRHGYRLSARLLD